MRQENRLDVHVIGTPSAPRSSSPIWTLCASESIRKGKPNQRLWHHAASVRFSPHRPASDMTANDPCLVETVPAPRLTGPRRAAVLLHRDSGRSEALQLELSPGAPLNSAISIQSGRRAASARTRGRRSCLRRHRRTQHGPVTASPAHVMHESPGRARRSAGPLRGS